MRGGGLARCTVRLRGPDDELAQYATGRDESNLAGRVETELTMMAAKEEGERLGSVRRKGLTLHTFGQPAVTPWASGNNRKSVSPGRLRVYLSRHTGRTEGK